MTSIDSGTQKSLPSSLQLLPLVKNEIVLSVESVAKNLETYLASRSNQSPLKQVFVELERIEGCFCVLELEGVRLFVHQLTLLARACLGSGDAPNEHSLNTLTNGFFLIHRYLEFLNCRWQDSPELLIPEINRISRLLKLPTFPQSYFSGIKSSRVRSLREQDFARAFRDAAPHKLAISGASLAFNQALKRFRLMYQIGLLSILSNQDWASGLILIQQSIKHLKVYSAETALFSVWALSELMVGCLIQRAHHSAAKGGGLCPLVTPTLCDLEKIIRQWQLQGESFAAQKPEVDLIKDLLYWLSLEESPSHSVEQVLSAFKIVRPVSQLAGDTEARSLHHQDLWRAYTLLHGPSLQTRRSVVALLNADIRQVNDTLNVSTKSDTDEYSALLMSQLRTISETLQLLELNSASNRLQTLCEQIDQLQTQKLPLSKGLMESIADALIETDNTVHEFGEIVDRAQQGSSEVQLQTAEKSLLDEVTQTLQVIKQQLQRFCESGCQHSELEGIQARFKEVLGGLNILNLPRSEEIIRGSDQFVSQYLLSVKEPNFGHDKALTLALLDTFADVVVSLEFYFHGLSLSRKMDDRILGVAEDSLHALGIPVASHSSR